MILQLVSGISIGMMIVNGGVAYFLFRQYMTLAETTLEFASIVVDSIREQEDGSIYIDPENLIGISLDHLSQVNGLLGWIQR